MLAYGPVSSFLPYSRHCRESGSAPKQRSWSIYLRFFASERLFASEQNGLTSFAVLEHFRFRGNDRAFVNGRTL
jgi:hypothetical protein